MSDELGFGNGFHVGAVVGRGGFNLGVGSGEVAVAHD